MTSNEHIDGGRIAVKALAAAGIDTMFGVVAGPMIEFYGAGVAEGLNVRQAEALAHEEGVPERKPQKPRSSTAAKVDKDADTLALEKRVSDALGLAVTVSHRDPGGTVQISYRNLEQLDEVVRRLEGG